MSVYGGISEKCSRSWRGRRKAESKKDFGCLYHVHMMLAIAPKYTVSQVVGYVERRGISKGRVRSIRQGSMGRGSAISLVSIAESEAISFRLCVGMRR